MAFKVFNEFGCRNSLCVIFTRRRIEHKSPIKIPETPIFTLFADFKDSSCVCRYVEKRGSLPANNLKRSTVRVARTKVEETEERRRWRGQWEQSHVGDSVLGTRNHRVEFRLVYAYYVFTTQCVRDDTMRSYGTTVDCATPRNRMRRAYNLGYHTRTTTLRKCTICTIAICDRDTGNCREVHKLS